MSEPHSVCSVTHSKYLQNAQGASGAAQTLSVSVQESVLPRGTRVSEWFSLLENEGINSHGLIQLSRGFNDLIHVKHLEHWLAPSD